MSSIKTGLAIAASAAALFASGTLVTVAHAADAAGVHCTGSNACKGTSECKAANSACKGQNACKGQGWVTKKSAEECTAAGGKVAK